MKIKSKYFLIIMSVLILGSIFFSYYTFILNKDYKIFYSEDEIPNQTDIISIIKL